MRPPAHHTTTRPAKGGKPSYSQLSTITPVGMLKNNLSPSPGNGLEGIPGNGEGRPAGQTSPSSQVAAGGRLCPPARKSNASCSSGHARQCSRTCSRFRNLVRVYARTCTRLGSEMSDISLSYVGGKRDPLLRVHRNWTRVRQEPGLSAGRRRCCWRRLETGFDSRASHKALSGVSRHWQARAVPGRQLTRSDFAVARGDCCDETASVVCGDCPRIDPKMSELRKVTLYYREGGAPASYLIRESEVDTFIEASKRLHFRPGKNPHNNEQAAKVWQITVARLEMRGPFWWTVPDLQRRR